MEADGPWYSQEEGQRAPGEQKVTEGVKKQVICEFYMKTMTNRLGLLKGPPSVRSPMYPLLLQSI